MLRKWKVKVKVKVIVSSPDFKTTHVQRLYLSPGKVGANKVYYWSNLESVHQVHITAGWTEAVWNTNFTQHFYTWPALRIEPQTFRFWVHRLIHVLPQGPLLSPYMYKFLVWIRLRQKNYMYIQNSIQTGFEPRNSGSWQIIFFPWGTHPNHWAIRDLYILSRTLKFHSGSQMIK